MGLPTVLRSLLILHPHGGGPLRSRTRGVAGAPGGDSVVIEAMGWHLYAPI